MELRKNIKYLGQKMFNFLKIYVYFVIPGNNLGTLKGFFLYWKLHCTEEPILNHFEIILVLIILTLFFNFLPTVHFFDSRKSLPSSYLVYLYLCIGEEGH